MDLSYADPSLSAAVESIRRSGTVSVVARVAGEVEPRVSVEPDARHYSASIMKLPILVAAYRLVERGRLDLDRPVVVHNDFASQSAGHRFSLDPAEDSDPDTWAALGSEVTLRVLVHRMVTVSGNLATDLVLDEVGTDEVAAVLAAAGCSERTAIVRGIEDYPARDAGIDNMITADDMARLMVALAEGRLAGSEASEACEQVLQAQEYRSGIPAGLPDGLVIGNKTGWITNVNHDVALVRAPGLSPVGLAVLVSAPGTEEEREAGIARIAAAAWAEVTR
ncbi:MAG TPA: serine hydrolase [Nocardioides sp.]|uniref:serine hydrolase n=1 Tax=Nocardioides sp. TaxID=35761 RepID=UPI002F3F727C